MSSNLAYNQITKSYLNDELSPATFLVTNNAQKNKSEADANFEIRRDPSISVADISHLFSYNVSEGFFAREGFLDHIQSVNNLQEEFCDIETANRFIYDDILETLKKDLDYFENEYSDNFSASLNPFRKSYKKAKIKEIKELYEYALSHKESVLKSCVQYHLIPDIIDINPETFLEDGVRFFFVSRLSTQSQNFISNVQKVYIKMVGFSYYYDQYLEKFPQYGTAIYSIYLDEDDSHLGDIPYYHHIKIDGIFEISHYAAGKVFCDNIESLIQYVEDEKTSQAKYLDRLDTLLKDIKV